MNTLDLNKPSDRHTYFQEKAQKEIENIKNYLDSNRTFVGFLLAKKSAGKGTYSKMFQEVIGEERISTLSVGDLVREISTITKDPKELEKLEKELSDTYRGYMPLKEALKAFTNKDQSTLIPTEFILALIKKKIKEMPDKAVFIDGFPRGLDQVSYALYFREIMNLRDDPDFFVLINLPESIIEARIRARVVCPKCNTSRNLDLLPTQFPIYDEESDSVALLCDNPSCEGYKKEKMVRKEGDELGIEPIRKRLETDGKLIEKAMELHGIPKVILNNTIPVEEANNYDKFEITPQFSYEIDRENKKITVKESPWVIESDGGKVNSLLAAPVVVSMIKQIAKIIA